MTSNEDIKKALDKNKEQGFRIIMNEYQKPVYLYLRRMLVVHDDAEDVMQEVFIRVFNGLGSFRNKSSISTWIFKIATNECIRFLNKQKRSTMFTESIDSRLVEKFKDTAYVDYDKELAVKFQEAILKLPEKQQIVFNLKYYEDMDYGEISKITGTSAESLKVNYHYAKEKIKNYILNS